MCLIIVSKPNTKRPSPELLAQSAAHNSQGIGIAWNNGSSVVWEKGITEARCLALLALIPAESAVVIHHRLATIGGESPELCHPFPLSGSLALSGASRHGVIAHNGHWSKWEERLWPHLAHVPDGPWSDSRAIAWLAGRFGSKVLDWIDEKVVLLTPDKVRTFGGPWSSEEELVFSNLHWQKKTYTYGSYSSDAPSSSCLTKRERREIREALSKRGELLDAKEREIRSLGQFGHFDS